MNAGTRGEDYASTAGPDLKRRLKGRSKLAGGVAAVNNCQKTSLGRTAKGRGQGDGENESPTCTGRPRYLEQRQDSLRLLYINSVMTDDTAQKEGGRFLWEVSGWTEMRASL